MHTATAALHLSWLGSCEGEYCLGNYVWSLILEPDPKH